MIRTNAGFYNLTKVIEYVLNSGINPNNGKQLGLRTGDPRNSDRLEELLKVVKVQENISGITCNTEQRLRPHTVNQYPSPIVNL